MFAVLQVIWLDDIKILYNSLVRDPLKIYPKNKVFLYYIMRNISEFFFILLMNYNSKLCNMPKAIPFFKCHVLDMFGRKVNKSIPGEWNQVINAYK